MGKFVIRTTNTGFTFHLKAGNGETIAVSEVYKTKDSCLNGVNSVIKNAQIAPVEDQTVEGFETLKNPKFELYKDKKEEFRFRLKAGNGEIIATGESYASKANCKNGIESIKKNVVDAAIVEEEK